jgi:multiple sugar transport system substrate-binding protein
MKPNKGMMHIFVVGVLLLLLLAACAAPDEPEGPVTITYWHTMSDPETAQLENVVAAFEATYPDITVETTRYAYDDFKPALLTSIAGGEGPDTARMDIAWVSEFADQGALMQLDGVMPGFEDIIAGTFPGPLSTNYWQGHYYGLPQNTNTQVLLWNKEVFDAGGATPPATLEEFAQVACDLTEGEEQYGYALGGTYFWAPAPIFYAMGGAVVDEGITTADGYVNGPESVAAFTMLKDLFDQGCISPNLLGGGIGTADGHATGLYAMIVDGPWMVDIYKGNYPDFEVNFAPIPTGPDGTTSSVVGGEDLVIFEGTEFGDAAMKWAAFLLSEESQKMMAEVGVIPTLSSLIGDESLPAYFGVFLEQLETAQARVPHPKWGDMDGAINNAYQRMLRGEQTVQAALDQAAAEINELLGAAPPEITIEPASITYWHTMSDPETAQLENVITAFEAANPGITVETTRYAYNDFKPALLTAIAGGEGPDTARMDIAWVSEFADQGALMQLDGVMPGFEDIIAGTFPGPLSTNYWQGHYYGLPQNTNTQVLLWNKEVFDAGGATPPATLEEFAQVACDLTEGEEQYGYALGGTYFWAPAPIFYAMGGAVVDEGITTADGYVNGPESVAAFTMLKDLFDQGCISPNLLGGGIGTADGHATGLYAMIVDGPWMVDIYKGNYPDFEVNFAPIPTGPDGTTSSVVGGEDLVIFEGTEFGDAAMKWAAFLLSEESQKMMAEVGVIPTLSSLIGDESLPAYFGVFLEQLETAQARVPHPKWGDMDGAINNAYQRMLRGEQTVQEALDQAADEINALLP